MSDAARIAIRPPELDEPARRLLWIIPAAIAIWAALLSVFSMILTRTAVVPQEEQKPVEARLVEIPPVMGGLQGNPDGAGDSSSEGRAGRQAAPGRSREEGCAAAAGDPFSLRHREDHRCPQRRGESGREFRKRAGERRER